MGTIVNGLVQREVPGIVSFVPLNQYGLFPAPARVSSCFWGSE